jgi:hypothetical protein
MHLRGAPSDVTGSLPLLEHAGARMLDAFFVDIALV